MLFPVRKPLCRCLALSAGLVVAHAAHAQRDVPPAGKAPFFLTLQMGGGAGLVAIGGGVQLVHQKLEPELLLGRVPGRLSGQPLTIFTFKTTYLPVRPTFGQHWRASAGVGGYINYTAGATMRDSRDTKVYQRGYYWFSTKVRTGLFVAPRLTYAGNPTLVHPSPPRVSGYAEFGTNDLYLLSRLPNKGAPSFTELLTLGFGSKASW